MRRRRESDAEAYARRTGKSAAEYVRDGRELRASPQEDKLWDTVVATQQYGISEVAEMLHIPEWRVKNFAQGAAYGIKPRTVGRKKLRLFGWLDLARIELANELVKGGLGGFSPREVGKALSVLPEKRLRPSKLETYLVRADALWECMVGHDEIKALVSRAIGEPEETEFRSIYALNVTAMMAHLAAKWEAWGSGRASLGVQVPSHKSLSQRRHHGTV